MSIPCRLRQDSPWERVTTSHHGSQVSLFLLLTGRVLSLVSLLSLLLLLFLLLLFILFQTPRESFSKVAADSFRFSLRVRRW